MILRKILFFSIIMVISFCRDGRQNMEPISKVKTFIGDLTQYGITWEFDKEYECGQFITGDYWIVGPIAIIGIIPQSASDGGIIRNGSQTNPVPFMTDYTGSDNGYDSRIGKYRSGLNVAMGISPSSPLILPIGSSLVSTVSIQADNRPQLSDAAVLTVLESAPPDGSFRPPYCGSDKTIKFNKSQINYAILPSLSLSEITANPNLAAIGMTRRPWIDHFTHPGNQTQYVSPQNK